MARLPRVRFSMIEIPPEGATNDRGLPLPPREVTPAEDPLLARLLVHCARRALSSGPTSEDESANQDIRHAARFDGRALGLSGLGGRAEAPPPLGETLPSLKQPLHHQRWPRRDDGPSRPR